MNLSIKGFALASGIVWGLGVLALTWYIILFKGGDADPGLLALYPGFSLTPTGSIIGAVDAFVDGAIGGALFAWLYNLFAGRRT